MRVLAALLLIVVPAVAKEPALDRLFPPGVRRGGTIAVEAAGKVESWPPKVWVEPGRGLTVEPAEEAGKLTVTVAADAPLGPALIRLFNDDGASSPRPFVVGPIAEAAEVEPNDAPAQAMAVPSLPVTLNGRLAKRGDVDGFAVSLDAGQTLVAEVFAERQLRSPMDATLQVATAEGFVLAQVDDGPTLDPRLVFQAEAAGSYIVRIFAYPSTPDSTIRPAGGDDYLYRLTLATGAYADHPMPLALSGCGGTVGLVGWWLPDDARSFTLAQAPEDVGSTPIEHPALANAVEVARVPFAAAVEVEPNPIDAPQPIEPPVSVTGRIEADGDRDAFTFDARKDERLSIRVLSRSLGFPLDPVVSVLDVDGKSLAEQDDDGRDARDPALSFKAPADGTYWVVVRDLNDYGGPRHVYRLDIAPPHPHVELSAKADHWTIEPGGEVKIEVSIDRGDGHDATLQVIAEDLPAGVSCEPAEGKGGDKPAKSVTLILKAESCVEPWSGTIRVIGHEEGDSHSAAVARLGDFATPHGWLTVKQAEKTESEPEENGDGDDPTR